MAWWKIGVVALSILLGGGAIAAHTMNLGCDCGPGCPCGGDCPCD